MSKDEEIQQLREKLARMEGERDALRQVVRDKVSTAPTPPPVFPYVPSLPMPTRCFACGTYYYGSYHACWTYVQPYTAPQPSVPWFPWMTTYTTAAIGNTSGQSSVTSGYPSVLTGVFIDGKAIT